MLYLERKLRNVYVDLIAKIAKIGRMTKLTKLAKLVNIVLVINELKLAIIV